MLQNLTLWRTCLGSKEIGTQKDINARLARVKGCVSQHVEVQAMQCKNKGTSVWQQCHVNPGVQFQVVIYRNGCVLCA